MGLEMKIDVKYPMDKELEVRRGENVNLCKFLMKKSSIMVQLLDPRILREEAILSVKRCFVNPKLSNKMRLKELQVNAFGSEDAGNEQENEAAVMDDLFNNCCDKIDWHDIVGCLRVVADDVRQLERTDSFFELHLDRLFKELKQFECISKTSAEKLVELTELEKVFGKSVRFGPSNFYVEELSNSEDRVGESAEGSRRLMRILPPNEKSCSSTSDARSKSKRVWDGSRCRGFPAQRIVKSCERNGEVMLFGICFSCKTAKGLRRGKGCRIFDRDCSICSLIKRKRNSFERRETESGGKCGTMKPDLPDGRKFVGEDFFVLRHGMSSSSDTSTPCSIDRNKQMMCDLDSDTDSVESSFFSLRSSQDLLSSVTDETISLDEGFHTPREYLSSANVARSHQKLEDRSKCGDGALRFLEEYEEEMEFCGTEKFSSQTPDSSETGGSNEEREIFTRKAHAGMNNRQKQQAKDEKDVDKMVYERKTECSSSGHVSNRKSMTYSILGDNGHESVAEENGETPMSPCCMRLASGRIRNGEEEKTPDEFEAPEDVQAPPGADSDSETFCDLPQTRRHRPCVERGIAAWDKERLFRGKQIVKIPNGSLGREEQIPARNSTMVEDAKANDIFMKNSKTKSSAAIGARPETACRSAMMMENLKLGRNKIHLLKANDTVDDFRKRQKGDIPPLKITSSDPGSACFRIPTVFGFELSAYIAGTKETNEPRGIVIEDNGRRDRAFGQTKVVQPFEKEDRTERQLEVSDPKLQAEDLDNKEKKDLPPERSWMHEVPKIRKGLSSKTESETRRSSSRLKKRSRLKEDKTQSTASTYSMWKAVNPGLGKDGGRITREAEAQFEKPTGRSNRENHTFGERFFIDIDDTNYIHIKSPKLIYASSDEESYTGVDYDRNCRKTASYVLAKHIFRRINATAVVFLTETPFAVLDFGKSGFFLPSASIATLDFYSATSLELDKSFKSSSQSFSSFGNGPKRVTAAGDHKSSCLVHRGRIASSECSGLVAATQDDLGVSPDGRLFEEKFQLLELGKAVALIREIESRVAEVRLRNAIAILPKLESLVREQVHRHAMKKTTTATSRLDTSSANFPNKSLSSVCRLSNEKFETEEWLRKILKLLTDLEDVVMRMNEKRHRGSYPEEVHVAAVYDLLKPLGRRIRNIKGVPTEKDMREMMELNSDLKFAVQEYVVESLISSTLVEAKKGGGVRLSAEDELRVREIATGDGKATKGGCAVEMLESSASSEKFGNLDSTKEKIFSAVVAEEMRRKKRLKKNFDRIERLRSENDESMKFLSTLVDKTLRRACELDEIRKTLHLQRTTIANLMTFMEKSNRDFEPGKDSADEPKQEPEGEAEERVVGKLRPSSNGSTIPSDVERNGALPSSELEAEEKAAESGENFGKCGGNRSAGPLSTPANDAPESSGSRIIHLSKIGNSSLYVEWTKPKAMDSLCRLSGYEVWVNGKLSSRVRNSDRTRAILYSVNPRSRTEIKVHALTDDGRRTPLTEVAYSDGSKINSSP